MVDQRPGPVEIGLGLWQSTQIGRLGSAIVWWSVAVVIFVVLAAGYVTWTASRVDRLHARAVAAQSALDTHLGRRASAAVRLSETLGRADLQELAKAALAAPPEDRELAENDLTRALRTVPVDADGANLTDVVAISRRLSLTRHVHNDLVRDALAVRRRRLVRLLRLAHHHSQPRYFDVDDPLLHPAPLN
jgi:hypothetical protein